MTDLLVRKFHTTVSPLIKNVLNGIWPTFSPHKRLQKIAIGSRRTQ